MKRLGIALALSTALGLFIAVPALAAPSAASAK
jgi:biopolymer transport protein ExbB/TolQ